MFPATTGGARGLCAELGAALLGALPLEPALARAADNGRDVLADLPHSPAARALLHIADRQYTHRPSPVTALYLRSMRISISLKRTLQNVSENVIDTSHRFYYESSSHKRRYILVD